MPRTQALLDDHVEYGGCKKCTVRNKDDERHPVKAEEFKRLVDRDLWEEEGREKELDSPEMIEFPKEKEKKRRLLAHKKFSNFS